MHTYTQLRDLSQPSRLRLSYGEVNGSSAKTGLRGSITCGLALSRSSRPFRGSLSEHGAEAAIGNEAAVDRLAEGFLTPDDAAGSRLVATSTARRERRPQVVEGVVRPGRFERPTYRFVVCRSIQLS
jgi:hypothetical protein